MALENIPSFDSTLRFQDQMVVSKTTSIASTTTHQILDSNSGERVAGMLAVFAYTTDVAFKLKLNGKAYGNTLTISAGQTFAVEGLPITHVQIVGAGAVYQIFAGLV